MSVVVPPMSSTSVVCVSRPRARAPIMLAAGPLMMVSTGSRSAAAEE